MESEWYEWDDSKAESNRIKHGVTLNEAATVLDRDATIIVPDDFHAIDEPRWLAIGFPDRVRSLAVSFTLCEERARIISARELTPAERREYEPQIGS